MIDLALPAGVERQAIATSRRTVPARRALPRPDADSGVDVVMVSGFFGTKEDFRELLALLGNQGYSGWAYDYQGQLEQPRGDVDYTIAWMADDLVAVIEAAGPGRAVHLIGHGLGGVVARTAALTVPDLTRSLTLLACGPSRRERTHHAMLSGVAQLHTKGGALALWPLVKMLLAVDDTIMREFCHAKLATMNSRWLRDAAQSMAVEPDPSTELTAAGIPALVVHGKRDRRLWSHDAYADMARRLGAGHVVIEKASHSPNMEQPARLADFWATTTHRDREPVTVPR